MGGYSHYYTPPPPGGSTPGGTTPPNPSSTGRRVHYPPWPDGAPSDSGAGQSRSRNPQNASHFAPAPRHAPLPATLTPSTLPPAPYGSGLNRSNTPTDQPPGLDVRPLLEWHANFRRQPSSASLSQPSNHQNYSPPTPVRNSGLYYASSTIADNLPKYGTGPDSSYAIGQPRSHTPTYQPSYLEQSLHTPAPHLGPPTSGLHVQQTSTPRQQTSLSASQALPPVQNWAVSSSARRQHIQAKAQPTSHPVEHSTKGASFNNSDTVIAQLEPLDKESRRKQESFRKKAEVWRNHSRGGSVLKQRQADVSNPVPKPGKVQQRITQPKRSTKQASVRSTKRVRSPENTETRPPTVAPPLRHAHALGYGPSVGPQLTQAELLHAFLHRPDAPDPRSYSSTLPRTQTVRSLSQEHDLAPPSIPVVQTPLTPDELDQAIVTTYEDYKWSVKLFQINVERTGCQFAVYWLEDQLAALDVETAFKWHKHTTEGFIENGDHLNFLVLQNATNPFTFGNNFSTTTFGYYETSTDCINWNTVSPDVRSLVDTAIAEGFITEVQKWHINMDAKNKRFHKAYWTAANMFPLRGLLNRAPTNMDHILLPGQPASRVEEIDDETSVVELDIENDGIEIDADEATSIWQQCLEDIKLEQPGYIPESVVQGSSEWVYDY